MASHLPGRGLILGAAPVSLSFLLVLSALHSVFSPHHPLLKWGNVISLPRGGGRCSGGWREAGVSVNPSSRPPTEPPEPDLPSRPCSWVSHCSRDWQVPDTQTFLFLCSVTIILVPSQAHCPVEDGWPGKGIAHQRVLGVLSHPTLFWFTRWLREGVQRKWGAPCGAGIGLCVEQGVPV